MEAIILAADDSSLFVAKIARTALSKLLFHFLAKERNSEYPVDQVKSGSEECVLILEDLHKSIRDQTSSKGENRGTFSTNAALTILALLFEETSRSASATDARKILESLRFKNVIHDLAKQLPHCSSQLYDAILEILSQCQQLSL